jgi:hypothetical protein
VIIMELWGRRPPWGRSTGRCCMRCTEQCSRVWRSWPGPHTDSDPKMSAAPAHEHGAPPADMTKVSTGPYRGGAITHAPSSVCSQRTSRRWSDTLAPFSFHLQTEQRSNTVHSANIRLASGHRCNYMYIYGKTNLLNSSKGPLCFDSIKALRLLQLQQNDTANGHLLPSAQFSSVAECQPVCSGNTASLLSKPIW